VKRRLGSLEAEPFRKKFGDVSLLGATRALKKDRGVGAEFVDDLAASAAGRAGHALIVDDADGADFNFGTEFGNGGEDGGPLGAVAESVGGVFNVASGKDFAVREQNGGAHAEVRVWCVRVLHDLFRGAQQFRGRPGGQSFIGHGFWESTAIVNPAAVLLNDAR
jgi:hypothetical protein